MNQNLDVSVARYLLAVAEWAADPKPRTVDVVLAEGCTECGEAIDNMAPGERQFHVIAKKDGVEFVVIGCEGYWMLNPSAVGIHAPNWQAWYGDEDEKLSKVRIDFAILSGETPGGALAKMLESAGAEVRGKVFAEIGVAGHPVAELTGQEEQLAKFLRYHGYEESEVYLVQ